MDPQAATQPSAGPSVVGAGAARQRERLSALARESVRRDPAQAEQEAQRAAARAREEVRQAKRHRRQARRDWATFAAFKAELNALGIEVILEDAPNPTNSQERTSDDAHEAPQGS